MFGALTALLALRDQGVPHARCVVVIEACEESGSYDLPYYIDHLADRIGTPVAGRLPRFRLRQLRPAVDDDLAARHRRRHPDGRGARRRACIRATPRASCRRASASCASCCRGSRTRATGAIRPAELYAQVPPERIDAGAARRGGAGRRGLHRSFRSPPACRPMARRSRRAGAEPHLAAAARDHRHRRAAAAGRRRQRAAALHDREAQPAPAADPGRRGRRRRC